jgi:hypothetical protein
MPKRPRVFVEGRISHVYKRFARCADLFGEMAEPPGKKRTISRRDTS